MKETLRVDGKNKVSNEFFDFHEKVNTILEEQEEIFATHMAAIKVTDHLSLIILNVSVCVCS